MKTSMFLAKGSGLDIHQHTRSGSKWATKKQKKNSAGCEIHEILVV